MLSKSLQKKEWNLRVRSIKGITFALDVWQEQSSTELPLLWLQWPSYLMLCLGDAGLLQFKQRLSHWGTAKPVVKTAVATGSCPYGLHPCSNRHSGSLATSSLNITICLHQVVLGPTLGLLGRNSVSPSPLLSFRNQGPLKPGNFIPICL